MKLLGSVLSICIVLVLALHVVTLWAIGQSRDRTDCYRKARVVEECPQPGPIELQVRDWLG